MKEILEYTEDLLLVGCSPDLAAFREQDSLKDKDFFGWYTVDVRKRVF